MTKSSIYAEFQLKEYENISQAHFKTNEMIASFYKYYFVIMAVPISTVGVSVAKIIGDGSYDKHLLTFQFGVGALFFLVGLVGVALTIYIEGLGMEAVLYARTVNAVRKYFYKLGLENDNFVGESVLPLTSQTPQYTSNSGSRFLSFLVGAIFNAILLSGGIALMFVMEPTAREIAEMDFQTSTIGMFATFGTLIVLGQFFWRHRLAVNKQNWQSVFQTGN